LSQAVGIGLNGPVDQAQILQIETFFRARGAKTTIDVCPLADPTLAGKLTDRGYRVTEFNNVLVKRLSGAELVPAPRVRQASPAERELWAHAVGRGFFENQELSSEEMDIGRAIFSMPGAMCYLASTQSGEVAAAAACAIRDGLATLFADSTIAIFRRAGLHRELIAARLNDAVAQGADLATASTLPGSGSQHNYERMGFQVAYTKLMMVG